MSATACEFGQAKKYRSTEAEVHIRVDDLIMALYERMINQETLIQSDTNLRNERKHFSLVRDDIGYRDYNAFLRLFHRKGNRVDGNIGD